MPAFVVHSLFGADVLEAANPESRAAIQASRTAYEWGLQGPDLLFFNGATTPVADRALNHLGGAMHREKTNLLFEALCGYLRARPKGGAYQTVLAYALGFCCHYALDSVTHPYIFWRQRCLERMQPNRRGVHNRVESDLDTDYFYWKTRNGIVDFSFPADLAKDKDAKLEIALLYRYLLWRVYHQQVGTQALVGCCDSACRLMPLLLGRLGTLLVARTADSLTLGTTAIHAHVRRTTVFEDVLNLRHARWRPRGKREDCMLSFPELAEQAVTAATKMQTLVLESVKAGFGIFEEPLLPFDNGART